MERANILLSGGYRRGSGGSRNHEGGKGAQEDLEMMTGGLMRTQK
jgi:hypothetical protein